MAKHRATYNLTMGTGDWDVSRQSALALAQHASTRGPEVLRDALDVIAAALLAGGKVHVFVQWEDNQPLSGKADK